MAHPMREDQRPSLKSMLLWMALDKLTGHGKEIDRLPMSSYRKPEFLKEKQKREKKVSSYQPPPLVPSLGRRKGTITPPILDPGELDQIRSPLFRLPEEVLILIYEQIIGGSVIHVVRRSSKLSHAICGNAAGGSQEDCRELKCRGDKLPNGISTPNGRTHASFIALLQTCRKIYINAIKVLYTRNIFDFDCMESLISFSATIVPHHFDSIQSLQLDLRFNFSLYFSEGTPSNDYARWERLWRIIGSMKHLQQIWCRITWWRPDITGAEEARYLRELLQVGDLRTFQVSLPKLKYNDPRDKELGGTFEVVRRA